MAKIPKPIFACFGINELCQFWLFQRLPNSATHFAMDSGSFYMLMFAIFGKNCPLFLYFYISAYIVGFSFFIILHVIGSTKNTVQVLPYADMLGMND